MAYDGTGKIYIPLEEFWAFVQKYVPATEGAEVAFGVPQVNSRDIMIDYAYSTEGNPNDWAELPEAVKQWKALKETEK